MLINSWKMQGDDNFLEFKADSTFSYRQTSNTASGHWRFFPKSKTINLYYSLPEEVNLINTANLEEISKDEMILTIDDERMIYKPVGHQ